MNTINLYESTYAFHVPYQTKKVLPGEIAWRNPVDKKLYIIGKRLLLKRVDGCDDLKKLCKEVKKLEQITKQKDNKEVADEHN